MARGICKLTREEGVFVKSHLIPAALTKPDRSGQPFYQGGLGAKPAKRWSSWYDDQLVIRKGEAILAAYDTWAISGLRRLKLVWSGWGDLELPDNQQLPNVPYGIRVVRTVDRRKLRLFFLSLLWRAAACQRWEFAEVWLPDEHLEKLRIMVLAGVSEPNSFYPTQLTQLSTRGQAHNQTPIESEKVIQVADGKEMKVPFFRFYMDGLVAHIAKQASDEGLTESLGSLVVGNEERIVVSTVPYEDSFQKKNLGLVVKETISRWPEKFR